MAADPSTPLAFDKDDDDTLDFVTATANLRASAYRIPNKTRFEVKGESTVTNLLLNFVLRGCLLIASHPIYL